MTVPFSAELIDIFNGMSFYSLALELATINTNSFAGLKYPDPVNIFRVLKEQTDQPDISEALRSILETRHCIAHFQPIRSKAYNLRKLKTECKSLESWLSKLDTLLVDVPLDEKVIATLPDEVVQPLPSGHEDTLVNIRKTHRHWLKYKKVLILTGLRKDQTGTFHSWSGNSCYVIADLTGTKATLSIQKRIRIL
jgi:hypothetical protein